MDSACMDGRILTAPDIFHSCPVLLAVKAHSTQIRSAESKTRCIGKCCICVFRTSCLLFRLARTSVMAVQLPLAFLQIGCIAAYLQRLNHANDSLHLAKTACRPLLVKLCNIDCICNRICYFAIHVLCLACCGPEKECF